MSSRGRAGIADRIAARLLLSSDQMSTEMTADLPRVRVVILSFDGGQMTIDCLESLVRTEWPADRLEIVMVDNGSLDNITPRVRSMFPSVRVLEPLANLGFAGGCNLGMLAPPEKGFDPDFIALVNNDATVASNWLAPLVESIEQAPDIGAVSAKMVFAPRFTGMEFAVEAPGGVSTDEPPGVCIASVRIDGKRDYDRFATDEGVYASMTVDDDSGHEIRRWTKTSGCLRVAWDVDASITPVTVSLLLFSWSQRDVVFTTDLGEFRFTVPTNRAGSRYLWAPIRST